MLRTDQVNLCLMDCLTTLHYSHLSPTTHSPGTIQADLLKQVFKDHKSFCKNPELLKKMEKSNL